MDLKFDANGLIPAIVQDHYTKEVLTLAYMNAESLAITIDEGRTCFFSRSRQPQTGRLPGRYMPDGIRPRWGGAPPYGTL